MTQHSAEQQVRLLCEVDDRVYWGWMMTAEGKQVTTWHEDGQRTEVDVCLEKTFILCILGCLATKLSAAPTVEIPLGPGRIFCSLSCKGKMQYLRKTEWYTLNLMASDKCGQFKVQGRQWAGCNVLRWNILPETSRVGYGTNKEDPDFSWKELPELAQIRQVMLSNSNSTILMTYSK